MSTGSQTTRCQDIPATRRVMIHDAAQMPQEYSATPGGTLFSTTPGGTRIIYDRKFLLQCRTSPLARTPPKLPDIPGVTSQLKHDLSADHPTQISNSIANLSSLADESAGEDAQFDMDI